MKNNSKTRSIIESVVVAMVVISMANHVAAQQTNELDFTRWMFTKQKQLFTRVYGSSLESQMSSLKRMGDTKTYLVVEAEKKRFDREQTVPAPANAKNAFKQEATKYYVAMAALLRKYVAALDGIVKRLMAQGKIDEANVAKIEKDKAEFMLADIETKLPEPEEKPNAVVPSAHAGGGNKPVFKNTAKYGGYHP